MRQQLTPLVSLGTWKHLITSRREKEFAIYPRLKSQWNAMNKKYATLDEDAKVCVVES